MLELSILVDFKAFRLYLRPDAFVPRPPHCYVNPSQPGCVEFVLTEPEVSARIRGVVAQTIVFHEKLGHFPVTLDVDLSEAEFTRARLSEQACSRDENSNCRGGSCNLADQLISVRDGSCARLPLAHSKKARETLAAGLG
ncbi:hypothetical protein [Mycobacterium cookii]|uniref:hypothetical protein n=1 Tax=Mycobacterium cookii TaxID=1775 RepID=UPI0013D0E9E6|nr:hypothetical protein [Mycobacterium cookii]